jgi:hypothetical protein
MGSNRPTLCYRRPGPTVKMARPAHARGTQTLGAVTVLTAGGAAWPAMTSRWLPLDAVVGDRRGRHGECARHGGCRRTSLEKMVNGEAAEEPRCSSFGGGSGGRLRCWRGPATWRGRGEWENGHQTEGEQARGELTAEGEEWWWKLWFHQRWWLFGGEAWTVGKGRWRGSA